MDNFCTKLSQIAWILLLASNLASAKEAIGEVIRELPNGIGVYQVQLENGAELSPGDIVSIRHDGEKLEATVLEVQSGKAKVSLKGVEPVSRGDLVEFARHAKGATAGSWGKSASSSQAKSAPGAGSAPLGVVPPGYTVEDRAGYTVAIPPDYKRGRAGWSKTERGTRLTTMFNSRPLGPNLKQDYEKRLARMKEDPAVISLRTFELKSGQGKLPGMLVEQRYRKLDGGSTPAQFRLEVWSPRGTYIVQAFAGGDGQQFGDDRIPVMNYLNSFKLDS